MALGSEDRRRDLMTRILRMQVSGETNYVSEAESSLHDGTTTTRPLDGGAAVDVALTSTIRIGSEAAQMHGCVLELETRCSAEVQVGLDGARDHGCASGHGWAICRNRRTSTLA